MLQQFQKELAGELSLVDALLGFAIGAFLPTLAIYRNGRSYDECEEQLATARLSSVPRGDAMWTITRTLNTSF